MKTNKTICDAVVKALKKANRELEMERRGVDHPWVAVDRPYKNKKKYDRKNQKKELRRTLSSFDFLRKDTLQCQPKSTNLQGLQPLLPAAS